VKGGTAMHMAVPAVLAIPVATAQCRNRRDIL